MRRTTGDPSANVTDADDSPDTEVREDIRYSRVRLGLWEGNLDRAVQLFPSRAGVALRVDPEIGVAGEIHRNGRWRWRSSMSHCNT